MSRPETLHPMVYPPGARWSVDLRALAACRILVGLTIVGDLLSRAQSLQLHYTDLGVLPLEALERLPGPHFPGPYLWVQGTAGVLALFLGHALLGLLLAAGYQTQVTTLLCWVLTRSLHSRQPWLLNGGDWLFAILLFWAVWLPWGAVWSIDQRRGAPPPGPANTAQRLAIALMLWQLPVVYALSAWHKWEPDWLEGSAVLYALESQFFARPAAAHLLAHRDLMVALNYGVMAWEHLVPFLLLSSRPGWRLPAIALCAAMHLSWAVFLRVGLFAWTPLLFLVAMLPPAFWDRLPGRLAAVPQSPPKAAGASRVWRHRVPSLLTPWLLLLVLLGLCQAPAWREPRLVPPALSWLEAGTGLRQDWRMFTQLRSLPDGWLSLDSQERGPEPSLLAGLYPEDRWAGYLWYLTQEPAHPIREEFFLAMQQRRPASSKATQLLFFRRAPVAPLQDAPPERIVLWERRP